MARWRPFATDSVWNERIPPKPELDPRSDELTAFLLQSKDGGKFHINIHKWSIPVFEVDEDAVPWRQVTYGGHDKKQHPRLLQKAPVPHEAVADPQSDAHLCIINKARTRAWDFWLVKECTKEIVASSGTEWDLTGRGYGEPGDGACRAAGFPLIAGLIRHEEIAAGEIRHALVFACKVCAANAYAYPPATETDGRSTDPRALPQGLRMQLDPDLDLDQFNLKPAARIIARALQEYGMFLGDGADGFALYAENFTGKRADLWDGVLDSADLAAIPTRHLRVLTMPPLRHYDYSR